LPRPRRLRLPRRAQLGAGARALGAGAAERAGAAAARAVGRAGRRLSPARAGRAGARWRAVLCRRCGAGARMPTCRGPHPSPWRHRASGRRPAAHPRSRLSGLHCADGAWGLIGSELSVSLPGILAWPGAVAPTCHRAATLFFARAGVLSRGPDRRGDARAVGGRGGAAGADLADVPRARDGRPAAGRLAAPGGRRGARAPAPARPAGGAGRAGGSRRRRALLFGLGDLRARAHHSVAGGSHHSAAFAGLPIQRRLLQTAARLAFSRSAAFSSNSSLSQVRRKVLSTAAALRRSLRLPSFFPSLCLCFTTALPSSASRPIACPHRVQQCLHPASTYRNKAAAGRSSARGSPKTGCCDRTRESRPCSQPAVHWSAVIVDVCRDGARVLEPLGAEGLSLRHGQDEASQSVQASS